LSATYEKILTNVSIDVIFLSVDGTSSSTLRRRTIWKLIDLLLELLSFVHLPKQSPRLESTKQGGSETLSSETS